MPTEASEIEKIIKNNLEDETKRNIDKLVEQMARETQQAIDRINGVYGSAISTLQKLELTDATIFDFFQKTNGNIRVEELKGNGSYIYPEYEGRRLGMQNPIYLKDGTRYKLILMAIEVKEEPKNPGT